MNKTRNTLFNNFYNSMSLSSVQNSTKISIIAYIVLGIIVVDTILNQNEQMRSLLEDSGLGVALFVALMIILIGGNFYVLEFVRQKSSQIRKKLSYLRISYKIVFLVQYLVISISIFVLFQIIFIHQYYTFGLTIVTVVTYGLTIGLMGIFTKIFLSWYKSNRNSIVILLYALSFAAVVAASVIFFTGSLYRFAEKPLYISHENWAPLPKSEHGSFMYNLGKAYHYSDILSFLLKWVATALLLYHYSEKMGRIKYWILISLPLVYFAGTYLDDYHLYEPHTELEELYWHVYTSLNSTAGGILFYIGFVIATRHFHGNNPVKDYLIMCGLGFLLFFTAGQSTLANSLYPPFGLITMSQYGLATYMILLGLYSCAISVSEDIELRKSIRKSTLRESKFLDSMGTAHMDNTLTKRMVLKARQELVDRIRQSGGVDSSLTEDDIIKIIEEAEKDKR